MKSNALNICLALAFFITPLYANQPLSCKNAGPQTPRDISNHTGKNTITFPWAPAYAEMNLCNIHSHTNAEHRGPDFNVYVGDSKHGGYACNATSSLTAEQLQDPYNGNGPYKNVKPGDTIEVHWVYSSCDVKPGKGLGACLTEDCTNPKLRVEAQVFLLVNDEYALDFNDYVYANTVRNGLHQAKSIPTDTGKPVVFRGSTTGPAYTQEICSPAQVTWSVRPQCAKLNIASLHQWAKAGNVFAETSSHGVRQLVTKPELLAPIEAQKK
jgi:hypothetical protein